MRIKNSILFILIVLLALSCDKKRVFDEYKSVGKTWHKDSIVTFELPKLDPKKNFNLYVNVRDNDDYPFNNLFLIVSLEQPNRKVKVDTLEYQMTNPDGTLLGDGFSDIKESKLFYKDKINFTQMQTNIIAILNKTIIKIDNKNRNIFEENLNVYLNINKYILSVKKAYNSNKISIIDIINEHQYQFLINYINSIHYILNSIYTYYEQINNIYERLPDKTVYSRLTSYVSNNGRDIYKFSKSLRSGGDNEYINYKYKNKIYYRKIHYNKGKKYIIINNTNIKIKT